MLAFLLDLAVLILVAFAAFCVVFNWSTIAVNARRQRAGRSDHMSMVFLVPQICAFNGYLISTKFAGDWVPFEVFWCLVLLDPSLLLIALMPFVSAWQVFARIFRGAA